MVGLVTSVVLVGAVPSLNASKMAFSSPGLASCPVSGSILANTTFSGTVKTFTGSLSRIFREKSTQMGLAALDPVSYFPKVLSSSNPTHTPVTYSGVKPMYQASCKLLVVPVFPALGRLSARARQPVPYLTTSWSKCVIIYEVSLSSTLSL